jgi:hypothetical protein
MRTDLGSNSQFDRRSRFLLSRYNKGAVVISNVKANYGTGNKIELGDIVALKDDGDLQLANFKTGERNLGTQLYEVNDRSLSIASGDVTLELVAGVSSDINDRYATISPSSIIASGTTSYVMITDSYGPKYVGDEQRKWRDYTNLEVVFHDEDYTYYETATLNRFDVVNPYKAYYSNLATQPSSWAGIIMDIPYFPDSTDKNALSIYKSIHAFLGPRVAIVSGISSSQFTVGVLDFSKFFVGAKVRIHTEDYTTVSPEISVTELTAPDTITVTFGGIGFTPTSSYFVTCIGFPDQSGSYRLF